MSRKTKASEVPGLEIPAKATSGPVTVFAWRDTDVKGAKPKFFLDIRMKDWPSHELLGVSPARIKALGESFLQIHAQLIKKPSR